MKETMTKIHQTVANAKNILIVPHRNPDGDAIGSLSALAHYLTKQGKNFATYCATDTTDKLKKIDYLHIPNFSPSAPTVSNFDVLITVDSGDPEYAGITDFLKNISRRTAVINIDHHPTNTRYGHHNLIIPTAASTTEIIFQLFKHNRWHIDRPIAASLLTGLITDTNNFTNGATSYSALMVASELIRLGANFNQLKNHLIKDKTINILKLWGVVLSRLELHEKNEVTYTYLTLADLHEHNVSENESEGITNFLNGLSEGKMSLIAKETTDGKVKISLRTTHEDVDVSAIAKNFGGGGHRKAAGFSSEKTITETFAQVWKLLEEKEKPV
ncbi:MAG TPA: bifunctional oligoribonuclease/PAP phosphatase NrnA [Candidatus Magasanikbacteria bacterium]|nr:bifunctional oligoribonuclease/PAP phosphatase NrnA [Candidatus Magasanikbacteria bacterium]